MVAKLGFETLEPYFGLHFTPIGANLVVQSLDRSEHIAYTQYMTKYSYVGFELTLVGAMYTHLLVLFNPSPPDCNSRITASSNRTVLPAPVGAELIQMSVSRSTRGCGKKHTTNDLFWC